MSKFNESIASSSRKVSGGSKNWSGPMISSTLKKRFRLAEKRSSWLQPSSKIVFESGVAVRMNGVHCSATRRWYVASLGSSGFSRNTFSGFDGSVGSLRTGVWSTPASVAQNGARLTQ